MKYIFSFAFHIDNILFKSISIMLINFIIIFHFFPLYLFFILYMLKFKFHFIISFIVFDTQIILLKFINVNAKMKFLFDLFI